MKGNFGAWDCDIHNGAIENEHELRDRYDQKSSPTVWGSSLYMALGIAYLIWHKNLL
jgi:hypothetical protein